MIDDDIPISHADLRDLFERLDRASCVPEPAH